MAQPTYLSEISSEFQPELTDIQRKQKLAELLMQRGMQTPQGQMVGGRFVAPSMTERLAGLFNIYSGRNLQETTEARQQALAKLVREKGVQEAADIMSALSGTPERAVYGAGEEGPTRTVTQQAVAANPQLALAKALAAETPSGRALLPSVMERAMPKDFDLTEGQIRYRVNPETGKPEEIARGAEKKTEAMRNFEFAKGQGFQGSFDDYQNRLTPYQKAELSLQREKFEFEKGKDKVLTESQGNAAAFGIRAKEADMILKGLENKGVRTGGVIKGTLESVPLVGGALGRTFNWTAGDEQQATTQARKNFVTAILRKESGASISPTEFENEEKKYFPQVGDSATVVQQKQKARETAIKALELQAGPGAKLIQSHNPNLADIAPAAVGGKAGQATLRYNPATGQLESVK